MNLFEVPVSLTHKNHGNQQPEFRVFLSQAKANAKHKSFHTSFASHLLSVDPCIIYLHFSNAISASETQMTWNGKNLANIWCTDRFNLLRGVRLANLQKLSQHLFTNRQNWSKWMLSYSRRKISLKLYETSAKNIAKSISSMLENLYYSLNYKTSLLYISNNNIAENTTHT